MIINVQFLRVEESLLKKRSIYRVESVSEDGEICVVEREMSEFQRLWKILEVIYPSQLIPPLPAESHQKVESLKLTLQAAFDHEILSQDEYLKAFVFVERFVETVPLIKNVEPPVQMRKEFFGGKWQFIISGKATKDAKVKTNQVFGSILRVDPVKNIGAICFKGQIKETGTTLRSTLLRKRGS